MNVRAKVCIKVGAMVRKWLGNYRRSPRRIWRGVRRFNRAASGESSGQFPRNCRALSEQSAGNVPSNTGECPHHGWRTTRRRLGNYLSRPHRGHEADRLSSQSRSRSVRLGVRATSDESSREFPGSVWAIPHETRSGQEISKDIPRSFHGRELATLFRGHANSSFTNCPQTCPRPVLELTATGIYQRPCPVASVVDPR